MTRFSPAPSPLAGPGRAAAPAFLLWLLFALPADLLQAEPASGAPLPGSFAQQADTAAADTVPEEKTYRDVITADAVSDEGLFTVHEVDEEYFFEIPSGMLGREMVLQTRVSRTPAGMGYGGSRESLAVVRWELRGDDRVLLRMVSHQNVADEELPIHDAVRNSNFEPIIHAFDVEVEGESGDSWVIDVSDFFTSDVRLLGLREQRRDAYGVRSLDGDRTFVESMRSFPENLEVRRIATWDAASPPSNQQANSLSMELAHSLLLLPEEPWAPRRWDERVGYFSVQQNDFGAPSQRLEQRRLIQRWRLEPSDPEAYYRGEVVDPVEPITFYIDPATPERWRPYLKQGVEDWQVAFEAAGFSNAVVAMDPPSPAEDPEFDPADVRYSMIRYLASPVQNASGPRFTDPRTGEILGTHIQWHHNVMNLLRNWYFVQTAAVNEQARGVAFDDEVMGELIRFVSAHEVGHTLGLPHNQKGHSGIPVDSLRTRWVCENGTSSSIMDYARFNYVAQPGDDTCLMPRVGPYDKWSVEWGYRLIPDPGNPVDENDVLNDWILEKAGDPLYRFGDPTQWDPGSTSEALGDDPVRASDLGIENLKRIAENLQDWTHEPGEDYSQLEELYGQVLGQWNRYVGHVSLNLGGVDWTRRAQGQDGRPYTPISAERQRAAIDWMDRQVFRTPSWMLDEDILYRIDHSGFQERIRGMQASALARVLNVDRLVRVAEQEALLGASAYGLDDALGDVRRAIWTELDGGEPVDPFRRNLQRAWVDRMNELLGDEDAVVTDVAPMARGHLREARDAAEAAAEQTDDRATRLHLEDIVARIDDVLD